MYIHDKHKPFPWRLRLSFAIDIARALAYLHARKCIHRDLKGENLLVTSNGRLKITDFGFARIAARNEDESKRLTFCGTDSYMSPEILLGEEFDLPTDIFSLGIIFCEIAARRLADDYHFKRAAPTFGIDVTEVKRRAADGCPESFIKLCLDCLALEPASRPTTRGILDRLHEIEVEVLLRPSESDDMHIGSVRFMAGGKRGGGLRIPSFGLGRRTDEEGEDKAKSSDGETTSSDDELMEAVMELDNAHLGISHFNDATATPGLSHHFINEFLFIQLGLQATVLPAPTLVHSLHPKNHLLPAQNTALLSYVHTPHRQLTQSHLPYLLFSLYDLIHHRNLMVLEYTLCQNQN